MAAGSTYTPLATTTLSSSASTVTFSSISGSYTDLVLICNIKSGNTNTASLLFEINGVATGSLYSGTMLFGNTTITASNRTSGQDYGTLLRNGGLSASSSIMNISIANFMNYSNTTTFKTVLTRSGSGDWITEANIGLFRSTSAITQIRIFADTNAFASSSTFTLYGIAAA